MLDTNHCLSFEPSPPGSPPMGEDMEKAGLTMDHDRHVYHSLKEGGRFLELHSQYRYKISDMICVYVPVWFISVLYGFIQHKWFMVFC